MRFDLAHELGHFILHDGIETGDTKTESEADKFASAFLFPRSAFHKEFPDFRGYRLNWKVIYDLKLRWKLSARAIIYKANYFENITAQQYRSANVWLKKTGQSKKERYDDSIPQEPPELLENAITLLDSQLGNSFKHIADKLGIHPEFLSQITGIAYHIDTNHDNVIPLF